MEASDTEVDCQQSICFFGNWKAFVLRGEHDRIQQNEPCKHDKKTTFKSPQLNNTL